jgi:cell division initiation protein
MSEGSLTPLQIEKKTFGRKFRGYDRAQVDAFLAAAAKEMDRLLNRIRALEVSEKGLTSEVERFRGMETTLKEALLLAQRTADETRALAHQQADHILNETRARCASMQTESEQSLASLRTEIERLRIDRDNLVVQLKSLVDDFAAKLGKLAPTSEAAVRMEIDGDAPVGAVASRDAAVES